MPEIEIEATRLVTYSITKQVSQQRADAFREAYENGETDLLEELLEDLIDPRHDVVDAERYDVMNALLDGSRL